MSSIFPASSDGEDPSLTTSKSDSTTECGVIEFQDNSSVLLPFPITRWHYSLDEEIPGNFYDIITTKKKEQNLRCSSQWPRDGRGWGRDDNSRGQGRGQVYLLLHYVNRSDLTSPPASNVIPEASRPSIARPDPISGTMSSSLGRPRLDKCNCCLSSGGLVGRRKRLNQSGYRDLLKSRPITHCSVVWPGKPLFLHDY